MHRVRVVPFDEMWRVAVAAQQMIELLVTDAGEHGGIGDLVAVQMQDRQDGAVPRRVQELVGVPARCQRSGLGLAIADDAGDDQVRIVERCAIGMRQGIAEFAALVDGAGCLRRDVTGNAAGKRELREQALHPLFVAGDVRIYLAVGAFQVGVRDQGRPAVPWAGHIDHVEIVRLDDAVQVGVDEVQARRGSPVPEQPRLYVLLGQRLLEQRIVVEIDLADRKVVCGPPVRVDQCPFVGRQHVCQDRLRALL